MKELKFKKDDWCFCEFKLQQIMEVKDGRITDISDAWFRLSSSDLSDRCFPVNMEIKRISDTVAVYSREFHELNNNSLNHPDLNRELIRRWVEMCKETDNEKLQKLYDGLSKFCNEIKRKVRDLSYEQVEGINLFRR